MRLATCALYGLILFGSFEANAIDRDKKQHFGYSAAISLSAYAGLRQSGYSKVGSYWSAVALTTLVGVAKEATEAEFSSADMRYNVGGAMVAPLLFVYYF